MHSTGELLKKQTIGTTGDRRSKPIGTTGSIGGSNDNIKLTKEEVNGCDIALSDYKDLISPEWYRWHCKAFYAVGRDKYHTLASQARADGKDPAKLFSYLLRKEMKK